MNKEKLQRVAHRVIGEFKPSSEVLTFEKWAREVRDLQRLELAHRITSIGLTLVGASSLSLGAFGKVASERALKASGLDLMGLIIELNKSRELRTSRIELEMTGAALLKLSKHGLLYKEDALEDAGEKALREYQTRLGKKISTSMFEARLWKKGVVYALLHHTLTYPKDVGFNPFEELDSEEEDCFAVGALSFAPTLMIQRREQGVGWDPEKLKVLRMASEKAFDFWEGEWEQEISEAVRMGRQEEALGLLDEGRVFLDGFQWAAAGLGVDLGKREGNSG